MKNRIGEWGYFRKTAAIAAMTVTAAMVAGRIGADRLVKTIEKPEGQLAEDGQWLCRALGTGEFWLQTDKKLTDTYTPGEVHSDWFTVFTPKPDGAGVIAAKVNRPEGFQVQSGWGLLSGVQGDYYVHSTTDPADAWIVKGALFESTYESVEEAA